MCRHGLGKSECRCHEKAGRTLANLAHIGAAANNHLDASLVGGCSFVCGLRCRLSDAPPASLERAKASDGLTAFDFAAAKIENSRHQPFNLSRSNPAQR